MRGLKRLFVPSTLRNVSVLMLTKVPPVTWPFLHKVLNKFWERNYSVGWYGVLCSMDPTIELGIVFAFLSTVNKRYSITKKDLRGGKGKNHNPVCAATVSHMHTGHKKKQKVPFHRGKGR